MAEELADRQKSLEEQENSIKSLGQDAEVISRNVEQNARYLTNMPPLNAVGILAAMDDQLIIDVFRKTEEIAQQEGASSMVPVWLMNMDPVRAAELQRKMALKPSSP
jgi:flagellar protein FlbB